ncbi:hypothetical protein DEJ21_05985 [Curtobacterium sp. MCSS17_006]|nr:hypothetical protein DEJ21_05985 [Curtobacterium sp. MCSS17_006]
MTEGRKPGRPRAVDPKSLTRSVRLSPGELDEIERAARLDGESHPTRWIAAAALEKARRVLA